MPTCCVRNCKSRTSYSLTKLVKYFRFPKDINIRQQWLDACQRNEIDMKIDSARVCEHHFEANCFKMEWTKPRRNNIPAKQIWRLKKDSIPTRMLSLKKERKKRISKNEMLLTEKNAANRNKVLRINTGIPTYSELVQYSKDMQRMHEGATQKVTIEESVLPLNIIIKQEMNEKNDSHENVSMGTLLNLLRKVEKENTKLLAEKNKFAQENQQLLERNEQLNQQIKQLQMNIQKKAEKITIGILCKLFTPVQLKKLMSQLKSI